jgi:hypothetical protein
MINQAKESLNKGLMKIKTGHRLFIVNIRSGDPAGNVPLN